MLGKHSTTELHPEPMIMVSYLLLISSNVSLKTETSDAVLVQLQLNIVFFISLTGLNVKCSNIIYENVCILWIFLRLSSPLEFPQGLSLKSWF